MCRSRHILILVLAGISVCLNAWSQDPDLFMPDIFDTLNTASVTAVREKMRNTTQTGLVRMDSDMLKRGAVSFGTPDIIKTLLTLPGVSAGNELMGGMYVHGGDGTDNLYLLDGVPLYNISHFGGIFSSFNTDVTDGLDFYKSGFPARYGSKLSSVVDVETVAGDMERFKGSVSLGLIDGRVNLQGPIVKGKTSFNLGYRRSWMDMMIWLAMKLSKRGDDAKAFYFMNDLNAGITHNFSKDNQLRVNFFWGADDLDMGLSQNGSSMDLAERWGNLTGSAVWNRNLGNGMKSQLLGYYTQSVSKTDYSLSFSSGGLKDMIDSGIRETGLKYNLDWFINADHHLRAGAGLAYMMYHYVGQAADPSDPDSESPKLDMGSVEPSFYVEDEFFVRYNLTLNAGFRYTGYAGKEKMWHSLEPRLALKWIPVHFMDVKMSYSRMSQGNHLVSSAYLDLPSNTWMPSTAGIRPMTSDQLSGGFYIRPVQGVRLNLEGWYKTMDHILYYIGPNSMFPPVERWESSFAEGRGLSYGMEAELGWSNDRLSATAYYTLSWSRRKFDDVYPDWFCAHNDNRHKINLIASWKVSPSVELYADWNYHTGNRFTLPVNVLADGTQLYGMPYNATLPDYHRLDLGVSYVHALKNRQSIELNGSVYNAYNNKNAFFAYVKKDDDGTFKGVAYSILPVFPTLSLTYRF